MARFTRVLIERFIAALPFAAHHARFRVTKSPANLTAKLCSVLPRRRYFAGFRNPSGVRFPPAIRGIQFATRGFISALDPVFPIKALSKALDRCPDTFALRARGQASKQ